MKQFNLILYLSLTIAGSVGPIHPTHGLLQKDGNQNHLKVHLISCKMSEMEKRDLDFKSKNPPLSFSDEETKAHEGELQSAQKLPLTLDFYYLVSILSHCQREMSRLWFNIKISLKLTLSYFIVLSPGAPGKQSPRLLTPTPTRIPGLTVPVFHQCPPSQLSVSSLHKAALISGSPLSIAKSRQSRNECCVWKTQRAPVLTLCSSQLC